MPDALKRAAAQGKEEAPKDAINVLAASQGTRILYAKSQYDTEDWAAKNLIDGAIGKAHGYSSAASCGQGVQEILFELPKIAAVSGLIIDPYTVESEQQWAKDIELGVSVTDPHGEFTKAGAFTIDNKRIESQDPTYSLTEQDFNRAKDVEVEVSTVSPKQGFKSVGKFTLHNQAGLDLAQLLPEQVYKVDPVGTTQLRHSAANWGGRAGWA